MILSNVKKKISEKGIPQIVSRILPIGIILLTSKAPISYLTLQKFRLQLTKNQDSNHLIYKFSRKSISVHYKHFPYNMDIKPLVCNKYNFFLYFCSTYSFLWIAYSLSKLIFATA